MVTAIQRHATGTRRSLDRLTAVTPTSQADEGPAARAAAGPHVTQWIAARFSTILYPFESGRFRMSWPGPVGSESDAGT